MENRTGYRTETDVEERKMSNSVPIFEQETHISYMRDENFALVYTSDSTQITRLDKLCKASPEMWSLVEDTGRGKSYRCEDKSMISLRQRKSTREMTEEQRLAASERLRKSRESKKL